MSNAPEFEEKTIEELVALIDNWMGAMADVQDEATVAYIAGRIREAEKVLGQKRDAEVDSRMERIKSDMGQY